MNTQLDRWDQSYSEPSIEDYISKLETEMKYFTQIQPKQDAQKEQDLTELTFKVKVVDFIHGKIQQTIDLVRHKILIASEVVRVNEVENKANKECDVMQFEIDHREQEQAHLEKKCEDACPDLSKEKWRAWFLPITILAGILDGTMCYSNYRHIYSVMYAIISAIAIATVIAFSHIFYANWIMKSSSKVVRNLKSFAVLLIAAVFFFYISSVRADTINNQINVTIPVADIQSVTPGHITLLPIFITSFLVFLVVFGGALYFWRSREEQLKEEEYKKTLNQLNENKVQRAELKIKIQEIQNKTLSQKDITRSKYNYVKTSILRVKNLGNTTIKNYKQGYAKFRTTIPPFFADDVILTYDEDLHFTEPSNEHNV